MTAYLPMSSAIACAFNWIKETSGALVETMRFRFGSQSSRSPSSEATGAEEHLRDTTEPDEAAGEAEAVRRHCLIDSLETYAKMHRQSIEEPAEFWHPIACEFYWHTQPSRERFVRQNLDCRRGPVEVCWMADGMTNIAFNCLDRHVLRGDGDRTAFHWVGNEPEDSMRVSYKDLLVEVCRLSSALVAAGARPDDTIGIFMGMAPEALVTMLASSRIGCIHVVVFGGYSSDALSKRLFDAKAKFLFTIDGSYRGSKLINLLDIAMEACEMCEQRGHRIARVVVKAHLHRFGRQGPLDAPLPTGPSWTDYDEFVSHCPDTLEPVWRNADATLFVLHTSGSTGLPKGIEHSHGGYMVYAATTFRNAFDIGEQGSSSDKEEEDTVFFCTGDVGWITGHTYNCYGPLLTGTTFILFEGIPLYPDPGRYWQICDEYRVTHMYTAPTAIRACLAHGNRYVDRYDMASLRVLGTVGEPINETAWCWFNDVVGKKRCVVVDTYFQTETGGHVITNLPYLFPSKPGCAYLPFFGSDFALLNEEGQEIKENDVDGFLVMKQCGPGMMKGMFNRPKDFVDVYFSKFPGYYFTGDGARRDSDGFYWITGRIDDMMNCSGHLISSAEIEGLISTHPAVGECSVIGVPHPLKAETPYAFVVLRPDLMSCKEEGQSTSLEEGDMLDDEVSWHDKMNKLRVDIGRLVRSRIGPFATPERVIFCSALPKTRSGKIVRRLIRLISVGSTDYGDLSALTESSVIDELTTQFARM